MAGPPAAEPGAETAVARALAAIRASAGMDAAFAARVAPDRRAMTILQVCGGRTGSLNGLTIASGAGLGGKSLALARPVRVHDYLTARGITHAYDHAVAQERLKTVAAVPVRVGPTPRYVVYVGNRSEKELGDRWLDALAPFVRDLEHEIAVADEVERRMRALLDEQRARESGPSAGELRDIAGELAVLAGRVADADLRAQLEALCERVAPGTTRAPSSTPVGLTPREVAVLEQVALGATNAEVAEVLGLLPNTVKSYLKSAMRKLGAGNRMQATLAARRLGVLR